MSKVTIPNLPVNIVNYPSKKDGSPQQLRLQTAYLHSVDRDGIPAVYPEKFEFILGRDEQPFPPGEYTYHESSRQVRNGRLVHSDSRLVPLKAKAV